MDVPQVYIFTAGDYVKNANAFLEECKDLMPQLEDIKVLFPENIVDGSIVITVMVPWLRCEEIWSRYEKHRRA